MQKKIIICADGTWNKPEASEDDQPTNVLRMARAISPFDTHQQPQHVFYDWGIGSYHNSMIGGATGKGINKNIMDGYRYIVQNYSPGDQLYFFGFSRGAYTVRSLCGLIYNCGILKREYAAKIVEAFEVFKSPSDYYHPSGEGAINFRELHSHPSREIEFIGVWDTVGALGVPLTLLEWLDDNNEFHDRKINTQIKKARHALAINEKRVDFEPTIWLDRPGIDLKQVWFAGAHSDVGGGEKPDDDGASLSYYPLQWMIKEARKAGLHLETHIEDGVIFSPKAKVNESRKHIYRLKKKWIRDIKHGQGEVLIHQSVKEKWEQDSAFQQSSVNLQTYLEEYGWPSSLEV